MRKLELLWKTVQISVTLLVAACCVSLLLNTFKII